MIHSTHSPLQAPLAPGIPCIILDAGLVPELQAQVAQAIGYGAERCCSLLDGTPYASLQSVGPFALLCPLPGALLTFALNCLEEADAGCLGYLPDEQAFEVTVEHWRSLLGIRTDDAPIQMMRFFEPRWLEPLLNSLDKRERAQFMGPLSHLAWRNELGWRHLPHPSPDTWAGVQAPGWLHLGRERLARMEQHRLNILADQLAGIYKANLSMPEPTGFVHRQLLAARQAGYLSPQHQERWLRLALTRGDEFWTRSPYAELLARDDLGSGDKLSEIEHATE